MGGGLYAGMHILGDKVLRILAFFTQIRALIAPKVSVLFFSACFVQAVRTSVGPKATDVNRVIDQYEGFKEQYGVFKDLWDPYRPIPGM